jgi:hypothetical protein
MVCCLWFVVYGLLLKNAEPYLRKSAVSICISLRKKGTWGKGDWENAI